MAKKTLIIGKISFGKKKKGVFKKKKGPKEKRVSKYRGQGR